MRVDKVILIGSHENRRGYFRRNAGLPRQLHSFRANDQFDRVAALQNKRSFHMENCSEAGYFGHSVIAGFHCGGYDICCADEIGYELTGRCGVYLFWGAHLFDNAFVHDDDPIRHAHGFSLVVRDIDAGDAELPLDFADFAPHVDAQFGVEIGQRFVKQKHGGFHDQRAGQGNSLLLAAGQLVG